MEKSLDKLLSSSKYYALSAASIPAEINRINYQTDALFWGLAVTISVAAGYSVYRYFKSLKRGY
ncbi:hypothetical protein M1494_02110 [Candidatus Parvarchaeota archaeon]|nr:hypothetical protein [Candidatus Parvarchaeota archaeon]